MPKQRDDPKVVRLKSRIERMKRYHKIEMDYLRKVIGEWRDRYLEARAAIAHLSKPKRGAKRERAK